MDQPTESINVNKPFIEYKSLRFIVLGFLELCVIDCSGYIWQGNKLLDIINMMLFRLLYEQIDSKMLLTIRCRSLKKETSKTFYL